MPDSTKTPGGPDPSTLETRDNVPKGIRPISLRVTYTESNLSDYISLKRTSGTLCIELGPPLFNIVRKAGKLNGLKNELSEALAAIGLSEIATHFSDTVMQYARALLPQSVIPETVGLGAAAYLLKKLWDMGKLILGYIHHASVEEFKNWMGLVLEAKLNSDIRVDSYSNGRRSISSI